MDREDSGRMAGDEPALTIPASPFRSASAASSSPAHWEFRSPSGSCWTYLGLLLSPVVVW